MHRAHAPRPSEPGVARRRRARALLIVPVSDAYVSPSWYPSKAEHGKVVPTWNYEVVHVHGELVVHDDPEWVRRRPDRRTVDRSDRRPARAVAGDGRARGYIDAAADAASSGSSWTCRGRGKRKLSQNRPEADRAGVEVALTASDRAGDHLVAAAMRRLRGRTPRTRIGVNPLAIPVDTGGTFVGLEGNQFHGNSIDGVDRPGPVHG